MQVNQTVLGVIKLNPFSTANYSDQSATAGCCNLTSRRILTMRGWSSAAATMDRIGGRKAIMSGVLQANATLQAPPLKIAVALRQNPSPFIAKRAPLW